MKPAVLDTYNSLKHAPTFEYDPYEVKLLGDTGALLLLGALLNRVAGNKIPMRVAGCGVG